ncbi:hypothetical protein AOL_s00054g553 [Orbilia oligospora ATCC 24927]|uniref:Uncharacterized protein n=1 Tax=Arthrobotrys oligospora (strain ATCC 24927 / CBS 115.81 / DSM 1491) TaxID=756982 RepID=G1X6Q9_ARTOA|nr:hypothetical protein AOL_s00054g553 [Orbilia oligospora ATCC 24927]EGX51177.1 hypothetical protein AOL_s00054g553 [Orbilia oligospora ATCC 24927]
MSDSNRASSSREDSQRSDFATAVVLSTLRNDENLNPAPLIPVISSSAVADANLIPKTAEEYEYLRCPKLKGKTTMVQIRQELGIPGSPDPIQGPVNDYKWKSLSASRNSHDFINELDKDPNLDLNDDSVSSMVKICQALEQSKI